VFKNKLLNISIIIIISVSLLGVAAFFLYQYIFPSTETVEEEEPEVVESIDDILPLTVSIPKINTNLGDSSIIVFEVTLQTDNKKAKAEADKRMFQLTDNINLFLKNQTKDSFSSEENINNLKAQLINRLNNILTEGKIVKVNITQLFLQ